MLFHPPRRLGLLIGSAFALLLAAIGGFGAYRLAIAPLTPLTVLWVLPPLLAIPAVVLIAYRLYGLLTARILLDRDGFLLEWGLAFEQVPLSALPQIQRATDLAAPISPGRGLWWPGCVVARREIEPLGTLEFFVTTERAGWILVPVAEDRQLVISPADPEAFLQAFLDANRLGALDPAPPMQRRPDLLVGRLWADRWARALLLTGLSLSLLLLIYLALIAPGLPPQVPFGFDAAGQPSLLVPPGRLLLLPFIAGFVWLVDGVLGAWLYRQAAARSIAYALWAVACLVGALFWGATLQLLGAV